MSRFGGAAASAAHEARVLAWSDEELRVLTDIEDSFHQRLPRLSIGDQEMICQRDMKVRGKRLRAYHVRLGDLNDFLPQVAA